MAGDPRECDLHRGSLEDVLPGAFSDFLFVYFVHVTSDLVDQALC